VNNHTTPAPADTPAAALLAAADFFEGHQWHSDGASYDKGRDAAIVWVVSTLRKRAAAVSAVRPPATDRTALRERVADILTPFFANFSDEDTARINAGEAAAAVLPAVDQAAVDTPVEPFPIWTVWREEQPAYGYFATEDIAKRASIDCWEEDEPVCPDYSWRPDGGPGNWELLVGDERAGVYIRRHLVYGGLPQPPRAAVLRKAADWIDAGWFTTAASVTAELRRMAAESAAVVPDQTSDETQPRRGDAFEAWLKTQRDQYDSHGANDHEVYDLLDGLLDQYRLHADTGTPLSGHVCEGRAVGDCDCLEAAPAVGGAQQPKEAEVLCRCGHGAAYHDAKYADPQCRLCPEDGERMWRHAFTPATEVPE
jgi:hypothetical protein